MSQKYQCPNCSSFTYKEKSPGGCLSGLALISFLGGGFITYVWGYISFLFEMSVLIGLVLAIVFVFDTYNWINMINEILQILLSHALILLGSVIHHLPTEQPHRFILSTGRLIVLFMTVTNVVTVFVRMQEEDERLDNLEP